MKTSTKDLQLYENGDGGEVVFRNADLLLSESLYQTIYLALFGGNVEESTRGNETKGEQRFDYWANDLLFKGKKKRQFNSETEKTLRDTVLNSAGRLIIEKAVKNDLSFLTEIVNLSISVSITRIDSVEISIFITESENRNSKKFQIIWSNAKLQIIEEKEI